LEGAIENPVEVIVSEAKAVNWGVPVAIASIEQTDPGVPLAVKRPDEVIVPQVALQVTGALAENCCVLPCGV